MILAHVVTAARAAVANRNRSLVLAQGRRLSALVLASALAWFACPFASGQAPSTFEERIKQSQAFFNEGKFSEALMALQAAGRIDPSRYEASVLAALVLHKAGRLPEARDALATARKLAPADKQSTLDGIAKLIESPVAGAGASASSRSSPQSGAGGPVGLTGPERRRYDALLLIVEEAEATKDLGARRKLLAEFLDTSAEFVRQHPDRLPVWTLRATAALELERERPGWEAGRALLRLGAEASEDPKLRRTLALLDRKGWMSDQPPAAKPKAGEPWENSLGMKFVPVLGTNVLFGVWETRVQDYAAFAETTGRKWSKPSFSQEPTHPAVNVSWDDAQAFCRWLTEKERTEGKISGDQSYRLPTDAEWSRAVGLDAEPGATPSDKDMRVKGVYPWGTQWPPPAGAGNYSGEGDGWPGKIDGYADGAKNTAGVGNYTPNALGLYDLGGNVWEWCEDWYDNEKKLRVLRGASFDVGDPDFLLSSNRLPPGNRNDYIGFRCVVSVGASPP